MRSSYSIVDVASSNPSSLGETRKNRKILRSFRFTPKRPQNPCGAGVLNTNSSFNLQFWSWMRDSNSRPHDYEDVNNNFLLAKQHFLAISATNRLLSGNLSSTVSAHSERGYGRKCGLARSATSLLPFPFDCVSTFSGSFGKKVKPLPYQVLLQVACGCAVNTDPTATRLTRRGAK